MNRENIEEIVKDFLIEELEVDENLIKPDAALKKDIGLDSLDFVDIVVVVEKNFGVKIKPEDMVNVITYNQFLDYLESKIASKTK